MAAELTQTQREERMLRLRMRLDDDVREAIREEGYEPFAASTQLGDGVLTLRYSFTSPTPSRPRIRYATVVVNFDDYRRMSGTTRDRIAGEVRAQVRAAGDA